MVCDLLGMLNSKAMQLSAWKRTPQSKQEAIAVLSNFIMFFCIMYPHTNFQVLHNNFWFCPNVRSHSDQPSILTSMCQRVCLVLSSILLCLMFYVNILQAWNLWPQLQLPRHICNFPHLTTTYNYLQLPRTTQNYLQLPTTTYRLHSTYIPPTTTSYLLLTTTLLPTYHLQRPVTYILLPSTQHPLLSTSYILLTNACIYIYILPIFNRPAATQSYSCVQLWHATAISSQNYQHNEERPMTCYILLP